MPNTLIWNVHCMIHTDRKPSASGYTIWVYSRRSGIDHMFPVCDECLHPDNIDATFAKAEAWIDAYNETGRLPSASWKD